MRIWFLGSLLPLMLVIGATKGSAEDPSLLVQEPVLIDKSDVDTWLRSLP